MNTESIKQAFSDGELDAKIEMMANPRSSPNTNVSVDDIRKIWDDATESILNKMYEEVEAKASRGKECAREFSGITDGSASCNDQLDSIRR